MIRKTINSMSERFEEVYHYAEKMEYNSSWSDGGEYLSGAVKTPLKSGVVMASVCPKGRKILLIGTPVGTVVVFERYVNNNGVYVQNTPCNSLMEILVGKGIMTPSNMNATIGEFEGEPNIGILLKDFLVEVK